MKIYTLKEKFKFSSEVIILGGLLKHLPQESQHCYNFNNISRYNNLIDFCNTNIEYVSNIEFCDIIVLPYKFKNTNDTIYKYLLQESIKYKF